MLLIAIEEHGNVRRAAEALNMSQPAASKLLKGLEDLVGVPLFDRQPRAMIPTWYGESMIRHARIALSSLGEAGSEIEAIKAGHAGSVAIGAIAGPAMTLLPPALARVSQAYPDLRVTLVVEGSDVLLEQLAQNKIDLMIGRLFARHDKRHLHYQPVAEEQVCAIARPGHPLLSLELMFQSAGLEAPRRMIGTAALVLLPRLLQDSDHLAVVPVDVARHYAEHGMVEIVPLELSCGMDSFGFITRTDWLLSPGAQAVLDTLKDAASRIYAPEAAGRRRRS
jgi:DNA-binding transcriptional LysR family regulator